jgi:capsid protein
MIGPSQEICCGIGLAEPIVRSTGTGARSRSTAAEKSVARGGGRNGSKTAFGYHFVDQSRNRRKISTAACKPENEVLSDRDREKLAENARDCDRNFAVAAWALRRHLDFVATWRFHCRAKDKGLRRDVEAYVKSREKRQAFDASGRHPRRRWFRLAEARRILDGDVFGVRLEEGTVQALECEQCRTPGKPPAEYSDPKRWRSGVYCDQAGRPEAFAFHYQDRNQWYLDRVVPAAKVWHHAYWGGRFRQSRGLSPIAAGLASLVDAYEGVDMVSARLKVEQLFAMAMYRSAEDSPAPISVLGENDEEESDSDQPRYEIDFGRGPIFLDLDPGDRAEFLQGASPSQTAREFIGDLIGVALKSIDIPRSFWDEAYATFHGSRSAALLYVKGCEEKREDVRDLHIDWTDWQLARAFSDGDLLIPSGEESIPYVWHSAGVPWWNPSVEVTASLKAIDGKITSRQRVVEETLGVDFFDLLEELADEEGAINAAFPLIGVGQAPVKGKPV